MVLPRSVSGSLPTAPDSKWRDVLPVARALHRRYDARHDLNDDGRVSISDLLIATRDFGGHC